MSFYDRYKCQLCGANLDPGEKCDCLREKKQKQHEIGKILAVSDDGQLYIRSMANEQNVGTAI